MRAVIAAAVLAAALAGCSSTPSYVHSLETHREAVAAQLPSITAGIYQPTTVTFEVRPDGGIASITAVGARRGDRSRAIHFVESAAPFPPHVGRDSIQYSITFAEGA